MIKVNFDRSSLATLIENLANGDLSDECCTEIAWFLEDCFSDGIEIDRLKMIIDATTEYENADEMISNYFYDDPYTMIREEEGDISDEEVVEKLIEQLQDRYGVTVLKTSNGYACIE